MNRQALADIVDRMHVLGVHHHDLHAKNVRLSGERVFVIDFSHAKVVEEGDSCADCPDNDIDSLF
jgi:tRNA A-37 threonylcarbamoyl transferase component Bud32